VPEEGRRSGWGITPNPRWQPTDPPSVAGQVLEYALGYDDIAESTAWLRGLLNETPTDRPGLHIGPPGDRQEIRFVHPWKLSRIRIEGDLTDLSIVGTSDHNSLVILTSAYSGDGPLEVSVGNTEVSFVGISLCSGGHSLIEKIQIFAVRPAVAQSSPTGYYYDPMPGRVSVEEISDIRHANVHVPTEYPTLGERVASAEVARTVTQTGGVINSSSRCLDPNSNVDTAFPAGRSSISFELAHPTLIQRVAVRGSLSCISVRVMDTGGRDTLVIGTTGREMRVGADSGNFNPIFATAITIQQGDEGRGSHITELLVQKVLEVRASPPVAEGNVLRVDSQGRAVTAPARAREFFTVRSESSAHFDDAVVQNDTVNENLTGLSNNKVRIVRARVNSVQNLDWELMFWKTHAFGEGGIDDSGFCGAVGLDAMDARSMLDCPYHYSSGPLDILYEDCEHDHELHVSLCNRSAVSKLPGPAGAVVVEIEYEPIPEGEYAPARGALAFGTPPIPAGATITSAVVHNRDGTTEDITDTLRLPLMNPPPSRARRHRRPRRRSARYWRDRRGRRHRMPERDDHGRFIGRTSDEIEAEAQEVARSQFSPSEQASIRASNIHVPVDIGPTPRGPADDITLIRALVEGGMSAQEAADRVLGRHLEQANGPQDVVGMVDRMRRQTAAAMRRVARDGAATPPPANDRTGMFVDPTTQETFRAEPYIAEVPVSTHRPMRGTMELVGSYMTPTGIEFTFTEDLKPLFRIKPRSTPEENWKRLFKIRIEITDATLNMQLARIYEASLEDYEHPQVPEDDHYRTMGRARQGDVIRVYITNGTRDMTDFDIQVRLQANRLIRQCKRKHHDDRRPSGKFLHNPPVSPTGTLSSQQDGQDCPRSASQTQ